MHDLSTHISANSSYARFFEKVRSKFDYIQTLPKDYKNKVFNFIRFTQTFQGLPYVLLNKSKW